MDVHISRNALRLVAPPELPQDMKDVCTAFRDLAQINKKINLLREYGTVDEIAKGLGVTTRAVQYWLAGKRHPKELAVILKLELWSKQQKARVEEASKTQPKVVITSKVEIN